MKSTTRGETLERTAGRLMQVANNENTLPFQEEAEFVVACATSLDEVEQIVSLFEKIARAEEWQPEGELRAHVARSTYFGLWQRRNSNIGIEAGQPQREEATAVAGLQLVLPDHAGMLPAHRVWPELPRCEGTRTKRAHIAMLAVDSAWRGKAGGLFWLLTAAMWNHCVHSGIRDLWLEATPRTLRCYQRMGWPITEQGELREHWGEPCFPCVLSVREVAGALTERAVRSAAYRRILLAMVADNDCQLHQALFVPPD